jgi:hypothetical protein
MQDLQTGFTTQYAAEALSTKRAEIAEWKNWAQDRPAEGEIAVSFCAGRATKYSWGAVLFWGITANGATSSVTDGL